MRGAHAALSLVALVLSGCMNASGHAAALRTQNDLDALAYGGAASQAAVNALACAERWF